MLAKNEVKFINSLKLKKNREQEGLFVAEGVKIVNDLLNSGIKLRTIYSSRNFQLSIFNYHIDVIRIKENELNRISSLNTPNEVLAVCEIPQYNLDHSKLKNKLSLVLDTIQDPGNLGTIIRVADWFGIENIICSQETVEVYNPKVIQATMGSISRVKVHYAPLPAFIKEQVDSENKPFPVYGALLDGESLYESKLLKHGFLVIGNESKGISSDLLPFLTHKIRIPSFGVPLAGLDAGISSAESLNAAIATAVICSEFRRRK
jgi:TrmH family RNA methyltransferase